MRVPLTWLVEYCDPQLPVRELEQRLTMTGTKVETVHHHGVGSAENFVVGRVLSAESHPDADRLRVCSVDTGAATPTNIVCGAPNVAAGQTVAVARPGAVMPGGEVLRAARLRGVTSEGMILAEDELQIGTDHAGIMVLDELTVEAELAPGTPLADVLPIATDVLELEITPNRPDCLAMYGVARELHAATGAALAPPPWAHDPGEPGELAGVQIEVRCPDLCPRFTARLFENVTVAPSPPWLKARLMAAGQRPISNVVDITNYVMLLTGQPLHAFDWDRVAGGKLVVRRAAEGEQVHTLDGQARNLDAETVLIEDNDGPTSIAGIMGGARSEVSGQTTRVLMEAATWDGPNIRASSLVLGLRSEASTRFEKGLAPEQAMYGQAVAARLMLSLTGATLAAGTADVGGPGPEPLTVRLRENRVQSVLGAPVARQRQAEILQALDFQVASAEDGVEATVPPVRRHDVTREIDLIEEVSRIDGLERLPATLPKRRGAYGRLTREQRLRRRAADVLVGRGLHEIVGWTFSSPEVLDRLRLGPEDERRRAVTLANPLSADQSLLRTTLLGSLLDVARRNVSRGMVDLGLFEQGTVFSSRPPDGRGGGSSVRPVFGATPVHEHRSLGVLTVGRSSPRTWRGPDPPEVDFYSARALLDALASALRTDVQLQPQPEAFLYPGRAAAVLAGETSIGWIGELHPLVCQAWDLRAASAFELDLDLAIAAAAKDQRYEDLISFPALSLDLAVVVAREVAAADVLAAVRSSAGELLNDVRVFDVYEGPQVGEGRRSLALALSFRAPDRTLTDEDIQPVRERVVKTLAKQLGGELRA